MTDEREELEYRWAEKMTDLEIHQFVRHELRNLKRMEWLAVAEFIYDFKCKKEPQK